MKIINKETTLFFLLFIVSIISVYYLPPLFNKLFFLGILAFSLFSKKNYFWLAFFIIIESSPLRLFEGYGGEQIYRIPQYDIIGNIGVTFNELFLLGFLIKAIIKNGKPNLLLSKTYKILLGFLVWLLVLTFILGISSEILELRKLLYFTLFFSVPVLLAPHDFFKVFKIFVIFLIANLSDQFISVAFGIRISDQIAGTTWQDQFVTEAKYVRAYTSVLAQFFTFIFGLVILNSKNRKYFSENQLLLIVGFSFLSIFMTGTRGWIIAFGLGLIYFLYIAKGKSSIIVFRGLLIMGAALIVLSFSPGVMRLFASNIARFETVGLLMEGDVTAGGTLYRITERLPVVLEGIKEFPILGTGFSKYYFEYKDEHVGWANQLLQVGIIGMLFFVYFWIAFYIKNKKIDSFLRHNNNYKGSVKILNVGLLVLLLIHSSSRSMFNITMPTTFMVMVIMYFVFADMWSKIALQTTSTDFSNLNRNAG